MKKKLILPFLCVIFVLGAFGFSACAEQINGFSLNETNLTLEAGKSKILTVSGIPEKTKYEVSWDVTAIPTGCVTVNDEGTVKAVKVGVAVVTATVYTKFGSWDSSCRVTVTEGSMFTQFNESVTAADKSFLDKVVTATSFKAWSGDQVEAWKDKSVISDKTNWVNGAFKATGGTNDGAVIVKTSTAGYAVFSYFDGYEDDPFEEWMLDAMIVMYTAIDKDGKFIGSVIESLGDEDYTAINNMKGYNDAYIGKLVSEMTKMTEQQIIDAFTKYLKADEEAKQNVFETKGTEMVPKYTGAAFIKSAELAAEVFVG